jgi:dethiobiotin synthetase
VRGLFVTGTDTGAGKTVLSAAIVATLRAAGVAVRVLKPVLTGLDEPPDPDWPRDDELLARVAGCPPEAVSAVRYGPPVSPHLAAELAGRPVDPERLCSAVRDAASDGAVVIVEGVGGLLVPLAPGYNVRRLAQDLDLPLVIAARPGLGTINHSLLTLEAARNASLPVAGIVFTPWPHEPNEIERSNRDTVERIGGVPVSTLAPVARAEPGVLAGAGRSLPVQDWLSPALR